MKKVIILILITFTSLLAYVLLGGKFPHQERNYILIKNSSKAPISNINVTYSNNFKTIIGTLEPNQEFESKLTDRVNETSVHLIYTNFKGEHHKVLLIPYLLLAQNKEYVYEIR